MHPRTEVIHSGKVRNLEVTESLTYQGSAVVPGGGGGGGADEKAKVSATDTTAGYLEGKLVAGTNVTLTKNNAGGNETLTISSTDTGITSAVDIQTFTSNGTWTKPTGAKLCRVILVSGGSGGGGGARNAAGTVSSGGAGGCSGVVMLYDVSAADIPSTVNVTVAAAAAGGLASNQDGVAGGNGSNGNTTQLADTSGNTIARAIGYPGGTGGSTVTATGATITSTTLTMGGSQAFVRDTSMFAQPVPHATTGGGHFIFGNGQSSSTSATPTAITLFNAGHILSGGSAGGSISVANSPLSSGTQPALTDFIGSTLVASTTAPTAGTGIAGTSGTTVYQTPIRAMNNFYFRSSGGSGGASGDAAGTIAGGNGGDGGIGAGGGGGGGARSGVSSGTGGAGGAGWVRIITFI